MPGPELTLVVAPREPSPRLRWLLNALQRQTLDRLLWEVIVVFDGQVGDTAELISTHPLAGAGVLRGESCPGSTRGMKLNTGWRAASAPAVLFTEPECRPPEDWLENALAATRSHPDSVIQGPVEPDPEESAMRAAPYWDAVILHRLPEPPANSCNIAYPRKLLDAEGGFSEDLDSGAEAELNARLRTARVRRIEFEAMLTYRAVDDRSLIAWLAATRQLQAIPASIKRYPELRRQLHRGVFWTKRHARLPWALAGMALARRQPPAALMLLPWALSVEPRRTGARGLLRHVTELPGWAAIDLAETLALARGSVKHRSLVL